MRKNLSVLLCIFGLLGLLLLAACGGEVPASSAPSAPSSSAPEQMAPSSSPEAAEAPSVASSAPVEHLIDGYDIAHAQGGEVYWLQGGAYDLILPFSDYGADAITAAQQAQIAGQLNGIAAAYAAGDYPLPTMPDTDHNPFTRLWPDGASMDVTLAPGGIVYYTATDNMRPLGACFLVSGDWLAVAFLYPGYNQVDGEDVQRDATADDFWVVGDIRFINLQTGEETGMGRWMTPKEIEAEIQKYN